MGLPPLSASEFLVLMARWRHYRVATATEPSIKEREINISFLHRMAYLTFLVYDDPQYTLGTLNRKLQNSTQHTMP